MLYTDAKWKEDRLRQDGKLWKESKFDHTTKRNMYKQEFVLEIKCSEILRYN